jgi:hypothetical protein
MPTVLRWTLATLLLVCAALVGQKLSDKARPQTVFQLDAKFEHPAPLPQAVLEMLRADEWNQLMFESCPKRGNLKAMPQNWFTASEVSLKRGELSGLVVKADNKCLRRTNIGPFWIFRHTERRYVVVLNGSAGALEVLNTPTNGYRDIRLSAATVTGVLSAVYKFSDGRYRVETKQAKVIE